MRKNSSGFIHLLLIPVVLLLIGAFLIFNKNKLSNIVTVGSPVPSSSSAPMVSWITYKNTKYNFTLQYPSNYNLSGYESDGSHNEDLNSIYIEGPYDSLQKLTPTAKYSISIKVRDANSLDDYAAQVRNSFQTQLNKEVKLSDSSIRFEGNRYFSLEQEPFQSIVVITFKNKTIFEFWISGNTLDQEGEGVFNQILASFKFTK